ncbi:MAG: hypothetical protein IK016_00175 [Lachnospiraceae bacterium]|nr:hypothetical protein [Lachnospiraceae bacterium]
MKKVRKAGFRWLAMLLIAALTAGTGMLSGTMAMDVHAATSGPPEEFCTGGGGHQYFIPTNGQQEASCTEPEKVRWCCGAHNQEKVFILSPATGHQYEEYERIEASCTTEGRLYRRCRECQDDKQEVLPALGHAWDGGKVTKEASCKADGVKTFQCTRCDETKTEALPKTDHKWDGGKVTKEASCKEDGVKTFQCSGCNETRTETIPKTDHQWDDGKVTKEASCSENGVKSFHCTTCGETRTEDIPAKGHTHQTVPGKAATCTEKGLSDGINCSVCGEVLQAQTEIAPLDHDWDAGIEREMPRTGAGLLAGKEIVYTCRRDTAHTKTEKVGVSATEVMTRFRSRRLNGKKPLPGIVTPLTITQQPVSGRLELGGTYELSVQVKGGVEPYVYTWYMVGGMTEDSPWKSIYRLRKTIAARRESIAKFAGNAKANPSDKPTDSLVVGTNSPVYRASKGDREYYCVIRDAAGQRVSSEIVKVLPLDTVILDEFKEQAGVSDTGTTKDVSPSTGDSATGTSSATGDESGFRIKEFSALQGEFEFPDGSTKEGFRVEVTGGEAPYTFHWEKVYATDHRTWYARDERTAFRYTSAEQEETVGLLEMHIPGLYSCTVTDATGASATVAEMEFRHHKRSPYITIQPRTTQVPVGQQNELKNAVTCEAVGSNGDDSNLLIYWEKSVGGVTTPWIGTGKTYVLKDTDEPYAYYGCTVVDLTTSYLVLSELCSFIERLQMKSAEQRGSSNNIDVVVSGGVAPYEIEVFRVCKDPADDQAIQYNALQYLTDYTELQEGGCSFTLAGIPRYAQREEDGPKEAYTYIIRVRDAAGYIAKAEVTCTW